MAGPVNRRGQPRAAAVLWDMDGLLVDSEPLWYAAESAVAERLGGAWTPADQRACVGGPLRRTARRIAGRVGRPVDVAGVETMLLDEMVARLGVGVGLRPGAAQLLAALADKDVPCGLVSSSLRRIVDLVLDQVGRRHFVVSVAGDEVSHRKPHPDPYQSAARRLGVPPGCCVVLEDSMTGILSAEAAGCVAVAVPDLAPIEATSTRPVLRSLTDIDVGWLLYLPRLTRSEPCPTSATPVSLEGRSAS